jgi:hypothetical protein|tara:strand:+ start:863 stop:2176 length:1314 start_codon:yes stop_codon:yes gene_type:complete
MRINNHYKSISFLLILLSITSFFIGFFYGENSAGAGTLYHDFNNVWKNLQTFQNNDLGTAINFTAGSDREIFQSSRTPLIYILHKIFNPFTGNKISFINSVFVISLSVPILFYLSLKQKFKNEDNLLLILISSTVCLSPFFRTSSYWGLEENYSIITLLLTFIFLNQFLSNNNSLWKNYYQIFLVSLFSSLCLYFDQKLAIIPLICFFCIFFSNKSIKLKILLFLFYFIFSLPYIYLITIWGNIIPSGDATGRSIGNELHLSHIGYAATIIAFYLLPFLLYKKNGFSDQIKNFFKEKKNYYLIFLFFIYLSYLLIFYDYDSEAKLGKGFVHKISILIFKKSFFREIFIYFAFFISWIIILIYSENNLKDKLIIFYFFSISVIVWPIFQEYFDPLIILMAFTFLNSKLFLNYRGSILFFLYLSILLISSNIYYYNLLN